MTAVTMQTLNDMEIIMEDAGHIKKIAAEIEYIAFQTNLLALNAAVEAARAGEQASGINQVNTAVTQIDQMTQQNGALVEETSASAEELAAQAKELMSLISFFKVDEAFAAEREAKGKGGSISPAKKTIQHPQPVLAHASAAPRKGVVSAEAEGKSNGGFEEF